MSMMFQIMVDSCNSMEMSDSTISKKETAHKLIFLIRETHVLKLELNCIKQECESFALHYQECIKLKSQLQHLRNQGQSCELNIQLEKKISQQKDTVESLLNEKAGHIRHMLVVFASKLKEILYNVEQIQSGVLLEDLMCWKREQQLQGNGDQLSTDLNKIQEWCEKLAEIIWSARQFIFQSQILQSKFAFSVSEETDLFKKLEIKCTQLVSSLVTSTFVIEKQPQQVIKTNTRITAMVRLLVGGKMNIFANPPKVSVSIINEEQAKFLLSRKTTCGINTCGDITENNAVMEYDDSTQNLSVHFKNLRLKKIKRTEKRGTESVTDEKFSLLFQSQFPIGEGELVFQVWTLSLPVVVVVHGSQDPHAWATVTWDNAFAKPGRAPFLVPEQVSWRQVAEMLKMKFKGVTGCSLDEKSIEFLSEKIFGFSARDYNNMIISYTQIFKDVLPQRSFTFWEWFYAVMKLTREHLRELWRDGNILGFVRKREAEEMLSVCPKGTFLLRFSDSELGGITIAWVGERSEVYMLQPFTSKDFAVRSLPDRICDLKHLVYLYLQVPKDQAFGKYYTPFDGNLPVNGYVKPQLVTHVPGVNNTNSSILHNSPLVHSTAKF